MTILKTYIRWPKENSHSYMIPLTKNEPRIMAVRETRTYSTSFIHKEKRIKKIDFVTRLSLVGPNKLATLF